jgi:SAM-dependent methyltransferase
MVFPFCRAVPVDPGDFREPAYDGPMRSAAAGDQEPASTAGVDYAQRLQRLSGRRWKRLIDVQAPYRWNVRRLHLGHTLDIGCGIGRNLEHLGGNGVGVDHNVEAVAVARARGLAVYTVDEFLRSGHAIEGSFDSLLAAHVVEHMDEQQALELLRFYLPFLRPGGIVCLITPQEAGFRSDATHVRFVDFARLEALVGQLGLRVTKQYSFPFPRLTGKVFPYNEFVCIARVDG